MAKKIAIKIDVDTKRGYDEGRMLDRSQVFDHA